MSNDKKRTDQNVGEAFSSFVTQAVSGTVMAMKRGGMENHPQRDKVATMFLAQYLNSCWMNLLRDDDEFVTRNFASIGHRSPVCSINAMFAVGQLVLSLGFPQANTGSIDADRTAIHATIRQRVEEAGFGNLCHSCHGKTLAEERQRWRSEGCPEEEVFRIEMK